jgi:hypothetical protein
MSIVLKCPKGSFKVWPRVRVRVRPAANVMMLGLDVDPWRSLSRARAVWAVVQALTARGDAHAKGAIL